MRRLLAVGLVLLPTRLAFGATLYVDVAHSACDDSRAKEAITRDTPWCSIQAGANQAAAGDVVLVEPGVYEDPNNDNMVVLSGTSGVEGNPILFRSAVPLAAIVQGQNPSDPNDFSYCWDINTKVHHVVVEGFEIRGCSVGVNINNAHTNITFRGNWIHDIGRRLTDTAQGQSGFSIGGGSHHIELDANIINTVGRLPGSKYAENHDHGVYIRTSDVLLTNNVLYDFQAGWAIHLYEPTTLKERVQIVNNTFAEPNPSRDGHIIIDTLVNDILVQNNIFYQPRNAGVRVGGCDQVTNVVVRNNLSTTLEIASYSSTPCTAYSFTDNLVNTDPLLSNPTTHDYRLLSGSPALDKGAALSSPDHDFAGTSRPQGIGVDIGAFETAQEPPTDSGPPPSDASPGDALAEAADALPTSETGTPTKDASPSTGDAGQPTSEAGPPSAGPASAEDSGCGCRVGTAQHPPASLAAAVLLALLAFLRRARPAQR